MYPSPLPSPSPSSSAVLPRALTEPALRALTPDQRLALRRALADFDDVDFVDDADDAWTLIALRAIAADTIAPIRTPGETLRAALERARTILTSIATATQ